MREHEIERAREHQRARANRRQLRRARRSPRWPSPDWRAQPASAGTDTSAASCTSASTLRPLSKNARRQHPVVEIAEPQRAVERRRTASDQVAKRSLLRVRRARGDVAASTRRSTRIRITRSRSPARSSRPSSVRRRDTFGSSEVRGERHAVVGHRADAGRLRRAAWCVPSRGCRAGRACGARRARPPTASRTRCRRRAPRSASAAGRCPCIS